MISFGVLISLKCNVDARHLKCNAIIFLARYLKCNVDAVIFRDKGCTGFCAVIQDYNGVSIVVLNSET